MLCLTLCLLSQADNLPDKVPVKTGDSITYVKREDLGGLKIAKWQAYFYQAGVPTGPPSKPWGISEAKAEGVCRASIKASQEFELRYNVFAGKGKVPDPIYTHFNCLGPVAVTENTAPDNANSPMLATQIRFIGEVARASSLLDFFETSRQTIGPVSRILNPAGSANPYQGIGTSLREYVNLVKDTLVQARKIEAVVGGSSEKLLQQLNADLSKIEGQSKEFRLSFKTILPPDDQELKTWLTKLDRSVQEVFEERDQSRVNSDLFDLFGNPYERELGKSFLGALGLTLSVDTDQLEPSFGTDFKSYLNLDHKIDMIGGGGKEPVAFVFRTENVGRGVQFFVKVFDVRKRAPYVQQVGFRLNPTISRNLTDEEKSATRAMAEQVAGNLSKILKEALLNKPGGGTVPSSERTENGIALARALEIVAAPAESFLAKFKVENALARGNEESGIPSGSNTPESSGSSPGNVPKEAQMRKNEPVQLSAKEVFRKLQEFQQFLPANFYESSENDWRLEYSFFGKIDRDGDVCTFSRWDRDYTVGAIGEHVVISDSYADMVITFKFSDMDPDDVASRGPLVWAGEKKPKTIEVPDSPSPEELNIYFGERDPGMSEPYQTWYRTTFPNDIAKRFSDLIVKRGKVSEFFEVKVGTDDDRKVANTRVGFRSSNGRSEASWLDNFVTFTFRSAQEASNFADLLRSMIKIQKAKEELLR